MAAKYRLKRRSKKKKQYRLTQSPFFSILSWSSLFALSIWLAWIQWFTLPKGVLGELIGGTLDSILGQSALLLPLFLIYGLIILTKKSTNKHIGFASFSAGMLITLVSTSIGLEISRKIFTLKTLSGGIVGGFVTNAVESFAGLFGALVFGILLLWAGLHILFAISLWKTVKSFLVMLYNDWSEWSKSRLELKNSIRKLQGNKSQAKAATVANADDVPLAIEEKIYQPPKIHRAQFTSDTAKKINPALKAETAHQLPSQNPEEFELPPLDLLTEPPKDRILGPSDEEIQQATQKLENTLSSFEIQASVTGAIAGPVVTRYELTPSPGVRVSSIVSLSNDIALAMKARGIRVEAPIPGKDAMGFEIPNEKPAMVYLREILEDQSFKNHKSLLSFALGRHADGAIAYADLEKMPHLLVAGATNSGKSICLHSIIVSILTRAKPDEVKFLLID
ncbi:MAG TPA: DNA translocase FtsK 4TM domain-containing protein, partial [Elusimicrobiales bacterium]|nr:DNA translocase FtsK 4TM domain-containing protein [Elusimicrobiales bacterium]